jgi:hypothetical protein
MSLTSSKNTSCAFNTFIQSLRRLGHFLASWKEAKIIPLPKSGKVLKLPPPPNYFRSFFFVPSGQSIFWKLIIRTIQKHNEERNLLNARQFCFRADHSTTLQCMRLADHVTLNVNNNMSTAGVFLDIDKAFDTKWHYGLLYINSQNQNFRQVSLS